MRAVFSACLGGLAGAWLSLASCAKGNGGSSDAAVHLTPAQIGDFAAAYAQAFCGNNQRCYPQASYLARDCINRGSQLAAALIAAQDTGQVAFVPGRLPACLAAEGNGPCSNGGFRTECSNAVPGAPVDSPCPEGSMGFGCALGAGCSRAVQSDGGFESRCIRVGTKLPGEECMLLGDCAEPFFCNMSGRCAPPGAAGEICDNGKYGSFPCDDQDWCFFPQYYAGPPHPTYCVPRVPDGGSCDGGCALGLSCKGLAWYEPQQPPRGYFGNLIHDGICTPGSDEDGGCFVPPDGGFHLGGQTSNSYDYGCLSGLTCTDGRCVRP